VSGIELTGFPEMMKALDSLIDRAGTDAPRKAAEAMGRVAGDEIQRQLSLSSHPPRTKTPSAPGEPPSMITGALRGSVNQTQSFGDVGHWEVHRAPTTVYARIQELGGWTGRGHLTYLPPRPYVRPALNIAQGKIHDAAVDVFRDLVEGT
jgi:phage gpG-like protein